MRNLIRNARQIYYARRTGERRNVDIAGYETGEVTVTYSAPVVLRCNVSATVGEDAVEAFGSFTAYSRTITVADPNCPLDEDSIVWFGIEDPMSEPHNYIVVRKADSKNGILYALQEVTVR